MERLTGGQRVNTAGNTDEMSVLKLSLHDRLVGYLAGFHNAERLMSEPWVKNQRLHPVLSNLLT